MPRNITFKGNPSSLVGRIIKINSSAPDFKASAQDLKEITLSNFKEKIKIITSFPSLDTPVCDLQVKEFNKRATNLSRDVVIIGISKDLPFAQKRFCETFEIKNITVVSDYKTSSFGINYGLLIKELNILARCVIIIDKSDIIRYLEIVPELTHAPNYDEAIKKLEEVIKNPKLTLKQELANKCVPCEGSTLPLPKETIEKLLRELGNWQLIEGKKISKEFKFKDFIDAKYFLDLISIISEEQGHHPIMTLNYNKLKITLTTHAAGGLTENDFIMARIIDEVGGGNV
ncbi:MAG: thiol peroxidase [Candidatus Omnitrophota bacterium]